MEIILKMLRFFSHHGVRPAALLVLLAVLVACSNAPQANPTPSPSLPGSTNATPQPTAPTEATQAAPTADAPAQPTQAPVAEGGFLRTPTLEFGVVSHLYYTDRPRVLELARIAGFDWTRQQIHWKDIEGPPGQYSWGELDQIVEDAAAKNIKLLINIVQSPSFYQENHGKPNDPKPMGDFVAAMAERYGTKVAAIEIWNEPNLAYENGGSVTPEDPGRYVELLAECYRRIKEVNPNIYVLAAAPSSTGVNNPSIALSDENYLRAMYSYKDGMIKDYFDIQAAHPGGAANSPDWLYPEIPGDAPGWNDDSTHYFRHVENVRALMVEYGLGDRQIWITEYGWATPNNTPGFEFGNLIPLEKQADYITRAVERVYEEYRDEQGRPWVGVMFLWNINFAVLWGERGNPEHEQGSFSILNPDWSPRPSFLALQSLHARLKQEQGRQ
jgi:hypothetical protein